jgi:hypothetical protein
VLRGGMPPVGPWMTGDRSTVDRRGRVIMGIRTWNRAVMTGTTSGLQRSPSSHWADAPARRTQKSREHLTTTTIGAAALIVASHPDPQRVAGELFLEPSRPCPTIH